MELDYTGVSEREKPEKGKTSPGYKYIPSERAALAKEEMAKRGEFKLCEVFPPEKERITQLLIMALDNAVVKMDTGVYRILWKTGHADIDTRLWVQSPEVVEFIDVLDDCAL